MIPYIPIVFTLKSGIDLLDSWDFLSIKNFSVSQDELEKEMEKTQLDVSWHMSCCFLFG